jgi:F0F1-type ATP synthase membrane subunit b/b'
MERAKNYRQQTGAGRKSLAFGFLILFAMVLIGGFIYQRRSIRALAEAPQKYLGYVQSLEKADGLLARKDYESAREELNRLIEQMKADKAQLEEEDASESEEHVGERRALLGNMIAKATKKLNSIPSEEETAQP